MSDLVSCCIPALNAAAFIGETLDSLVGQTHSPVEIIVVDDGSTDGTADVVRNHPADAVLISEGHRGLVGARDRAMAAATGGWIAHCDADDLWEPHKLERQLAVLAADPDADVCVTAYRNFWDDEAEAAAYAGHPLSEPITGWIVPTMLARRDVFSHFGGFSDATRPSDTGWFAGAVASGLTVVTLDEVLMHRRIHSANDSRRPGPDLDGLFDLIKIRNDSRRAER